MAPKNPTLQVATPPSGSWVQIDRAALERWGKLTMAHPRASQLLQVMISNMGRHNALVASQATLASLLGCSAKTIRRNLDILIEHNWIEVRQVGPSGNGSAYIVNSRVAWSGKRDGIRYALFEAAVLVSDAEQPDRDEIGVQPPLEAVPLMLPGERQLPTGDGLPPPSEPTLPGLEPDLPARHQMDIEDFTK
jgi:DNA-binding transcriptional MocR family regulator